MQQREMGRLFEAARPMRSKSITTTVHAKAHTNSPQTVPATLRMVTICAVLFLSGIGALIFETLWLRLSGLAFGNSVWAAALILSSFMAGLALGNALAPSSRISRWRPLYFFPAFGGLVAVFGFAIFFCLSLAC